jgi:hypothetical protein
MNSATGALMALVLLLVLAVLLVAAPAIERFTRRGAQPDVIKPVQDAPGPRGHEPGECWCGDVHETAFPADHEASWGMS